jgi:ribonuclease D
MSEFTLVDDAATWSAVAARLSSADRVALDFEADGYHRYPERLSLVQIALADGSIYLVDPLAVPGLPGLGEVLADPTVPKLLHSADYDLRMLDRHLGLRLHNLYDTAIAAQFCGARRLGLGNVLAEFLELTLDKPRRLQTLDWSQRPLADDALAYAAGDVAYLFDLADTLAAKLAELNRSAWAAEECARLELVRYSPPDPPEKAFLGTPGARDLSPQGLAVLRALYVFREDEALHIGRPPHHVMSNAALIALAADPKAELAKVVGIGRRTLSGEPRARLIAALKQGQRAEPVVWPKRSGDAYWTAEARKRLTALKQWRSAEAERLELDPGVVWPAPHLEQIALHPEKPGPALDKGEPPWVRQWQWQVLGASLEAYRTAGLEDTAAVARPAEGGGGE